MKRVICWMLMVVLILGVTATAYAVEATSCTVSADSVIATGSQITVPVRISDNPGFTNLGIALDYDREKLTLVSINTAENDTAYLCSSVVSTNTAWSGEDGKTYGYVTGASAEAVAEDGILFTATFQVSNGFSGTAAVIPIVKYIRNNTAVFSVFEEITATVQAGTVNAGLAGDLDGDQLVSMAEVLQVLKAYSSGQASDAVLSSVDENKNGLIDMGEVLQVLRNY